MASGRSLSGKVATRDMEASFFFRAIKQFERPSNEVVVSSKRCSKMNMFREHGILSDEMEEALLRISSVLKARFKKESPRILLINATESGGGVAEMRPDTTSLLRDLGFDAKWMVIDGCPTFFDVTVHFHEAVQDPQFERVVTPEECRIHQLGALWNFDRMEPIIQEADVVWIDDPQPLCLIPLVRALYPEKIVISRIHVQVNPIPSLRSYLKGIIEGNLTEGRDTVILNYLRGRLGIEGVVDLLPQSLKADGAVFHIQAFADALSLVNVPTFIMGPAINPISCKNRPVPRNFIYETLKKYYIIDENYPLDEPLPPIITEISRFDPCKGPLEIVAAFVTMLTMTDDIELRKSARLVFAGNIPTDNPSGIQLFRAMKRFLRNLPAAVLSLPGLNDIKDRVFLINLEDQIVENKRILSKRIPPTDDPFSNSTGAFLTPAQAEALRKGTPDALFCIQPEVGEDGHEDKVAGLSGRDINHFEVNALQTAALVRGQFSGKEGFGLVVSEAMVKKTPEGLASGVMVATDVGGIPSQVVEGCGLLTHYNKEEVTNNLAMYRSIREWHTDDPRERLKRDPSSVKLQPLYEQLSLQTSVIAFAKNMLRVISMNDEERAAIHSSGRKYVVDNFSTVGNVRNILEAIEMFSTKRE